MFSRKGHADARKCTQKALDPKRDVLTRLKHLRALLGESRGTARHGTELGGVCVWGGGDVFFLKTCRSAAALLRAHLWSRGALLATAPAGWQCLSSRGCRSAIYCPWFCKLAPVTQRQNIGSAVLFGHTVANSPPEVYSEDPCVQAAPFSFVLLF